MGASFLNLVATKVTVKGEEQKFVSLCLRQGFNRHHTFTVVVNYLSPNNTFQQTPEKFIGYIGETASISFAHKQTGESYDFEGVITRVEMVGSMGETGGVAIHGASPTILYENNRTLDSWMDQSLSTIIKEATQEYGKVNLISNPKYATPIPYMAQYNESVFDFMNRLSALYGEWFYYDGTKVYFGKPEKDNTEKIVYDMDLEEVRLVANLIPGKSARYDYVAQENKQHNADTPAKPDGMNDLQSIAHGCSEKAYAAKTTSAANPHITDKAGLDEQMKVVRNESGANLLNIKGIGKTCRIRIGEIIDVSFPDRMGLSPLGKFRIVCPFRFQGQYEDEETDLYYNRFRYYSSKNGVYISQDPIRLNGRNTIFYSYVKDGNKGIDLFGLMPLSNPVNQGHHIVPHQAATDLGIQPFNSQVGVPALYFSDTQFTGIEHSAMHGYNNIGKNTKPLVKASQIRANGMSADEWLQSLEAHYKNPAIQTVRGDLHLINANGTKGVLIKANVTPSEAWDLTKEWANKQGANSFH
jgi:RHS repeat-associated protein